MADGPPPTPGSDPAQPRPIDPPPPLSSIRVKGPGAKGLNKPAILIAGGGGLAVVLLLASGSLTPDKTKTPAETRPMMSDPARPEMAQTAIRDLPATYADAGAMQAMRGPAQPPLLGPPLPGDVAAFAPDQTAPPATQARWEQPPSSYAPPNQPDPAEEATQEAERSGIFFELRQSAQPAAAQPAPQQQNPLTTLARAPDDQQVQPQTQDNTRAVYPGAIIPASLITAINSEAPGPVIAQVTQSIYDSLTGRTLLIPQGARLIGDYKSNSKYGQARVAVTWSRLIMPDGDEIKLDEIAVDPAGATGVKGQVDSHWLDVFGAAALGTLINIGVAATEQNPAITFGGAGVVSNYDQVQDALRDGVQRSAAIVTNRVIDRALSVPPTIRVDAGTRISVISTKRVEF